MPLAPGAPPSPALSGRDLAWFDGVLARAREYTRRVATALSDADLAREVRRQRPDGTERVFNVGCGARTIDYAMRSAKTSSRACGPCSTVRRRMRST